MSNLKNKFTIEKTLSIVLVVVILFSTGCILGAVSSQNAALDAAAVIADTTQSTTETTTQTTTQPTTESTTTTTQPSSDDTTTTQAAEEEGSDGILGMITGLLIKLLEFKKQIVDFIISILQSI